MTLGSFEPDVDYLRALGREIKQRGFRVELASVEPLGKGKVRILDRTPL